MMQEAENLEKEVIVKGEDEKYRGTDCLPRQRNETICTCWVMEKHP